MALILVKIHHCGSCDFQMNIDLGIPSEGVKV